MVFAADVIRSASSFSNTALQLAGKIGNCLPTPARCLDKQILSRKIVMINICNQLLLPFPVRKMETQSMNALQVASFFLLCTSPPSFPIVFDQMAETYRLIIENFPEMSNFLGIQI